MDNKVEMYQLLQRQSLPLDAKISLTKQRMREYARLTDHQMYVCFSGGKDSTVLLDIVRKIFPNIPAVFCDTGLEYPEIRDFVKTIDNVTWIKPQMSFKAVIDKYGYPVVSKETSQKIYDIRNTKSDKFRHKRLYGDKNGSGKIPNKWKYLVDCDFKIDCKCCNVMKKRPFKVYEKESKRYPIVGTMAGDSRLRMQSYMRYGCNNFGDNKKQSMPLGFWVEKDIWEYIKKFDLPYSDIYKKGYHRTGCMFCMFGLHMEPKPNRFDLMKNTHPKQYKYCMEKLGLEKVLKVLNINQQLDIFE